MVWWLILGLILFAAAAHAQQPPKYNIIGPGASSCGTWTVDQRTNHGLYHLDQAWVLGFLSGIGYMGGSNSNPLRGLDSDAVTAWIDNYCQAHPLEGIATAAAVFARVHPR
jgi:hypothetical protein